MNQKTTDELMKILSGITNKTDLGNYTDTLSKDDVPDFAGYINDIINDNNLQTPSRCYKGIPHPTELRLPDP